MPWCPRANTKFRDVEKIHEKKLKHGFPLYFIQGYHLITEGNKEWGILRKFLLFTIDFNMSLMLRYEHLCNLHYLGISAG